MKVGQLSGIDYFDLHSFYFGCSLVTTDLISLGGIFPNVPTPCTVSLKGAQRPKYTVSRTLLTTPSSLPLPGYYRGRLIGEQQFDFRPGSSSSLGERAQLHAGQCHSHFQGVDKVSAGRRNSGGVCARRLTGARGLGRVQDRQPNAQGTYPRQHQLPARSMRLGPGSRPLLLEDNEERRQVSPSECMMHSLERQTILVLRLVL